MDYKQIAINSILMALDEKECNDVGIIFNGQSRRLIYDNAIKMLDFYEPHIKSESPTSRTLIIIEIEKKIFKSE